MVLLIGAQVASAAPIPITMPSFVDMAVDEAHGSVYLTGGAATSAITVLNLDGSPKTTIEGVVGARDIVRSHDGTVLYVAIQDQHAIGVIDPATNTITKMSLGATVCPISMAQMGGVLWFSYNICGESAGLLGSLRLSDADVALDLGTSSYSLLASAPALGGRIVAYDASVVVFLDVSGGHGVPPVRGPSAVSSDVRDLAITPNGSQVIVAGASAFPSYAHVGYSTVNLAQTSIYGGPSHLQPMSVAIRWDGVIAASMRFDNYVDVSVFDQGKSIPWRSFEFGWYFSAVPRGLEFGAQTLYAIVSGGTEHFFQRLSPRRATSMRLTSSAATYDYLATATVKARLTGGSSNRIVNIYAQPYGGTKRLIKRGAVDSKGTLIASLRVARRTTFTATYAGDAGHNPAEATRTVLARARTSIAITKIVGTSSIYKLVRSGSRPFAIGTITPRNGTDCAFIQIQQPQGNLWAYTQTTECNRLDAYGRVGVWFNSTWTPGSQLRVRVMTHGNIRNEHTTSKWAYVRFVR